MYRGYGVIHLLPQINAQCTVELLHMYEDFHLVSTYTAVKTNPVIMEIKLMFQIGVFFQSITFKELIHKTEDG